MATRTGPPLGEGATLAGGSNAPSSRANVTDYAPACHGACPRGRNLPYPPSSPCERALPPRYRPRSGSFTKKKWRKSMSLRLKFNLSLLVVMLLGLGVSGYFLQDLLQNNAREEVLHEAGLMMESALAIRAYTVDHVRPRL